MSNPVFVVSEWLAKEGKDAELWDVLNGLMVLSRQEKGCVRAHATRQISHPGSPSTSKYTIVLLQEYNDIAAFDAHCAADYVTNAFKQFIENKDTAIVEDWQCRLFSEEA
ncbi:MAG TPA: antibiotic biosynthesis monooxygenase [Gammaproteobacteria bacterium]|nr:antibiotic biosynthesis monooxygenase [Gammaproteobacteria bacterium]